MPLRSYVQSSTPEIAALEHADAGLAIRRIAVPAAFAFLGDQLLGIVDTIAIGTLGTAALAQITTAMSVFLVFGIGLFGFGSGLRILGAQAIGAGRSERFGTIVRSSIVVPLGLAIVIAGALAICAHPLMAAMLPPHVTTTGAARYLAIRGLSLVPMVVTGMLATAFATSGDTKISLRILIVVNLVHIPLLGILALGALTHHPLGLGGAALSSLVAELIACAYTIAQTVQRPEFRIFSSRRIERELVLATASLSWPDFVFLALQLIPAPVTVALLAPSGAETIGALRALEVVNDATWALPGSLGDAFGTIVGQRIGASDYDGAETFLCKGRAIALRTCALAAAIVAALAWPLSALFTFSPRLATIAFAPLAAHVALTLPLKGLAMANVAPIRAAGDTRWVMRMGIFTTLISIGTIVLGIEVFHIGLWSLPLGFSVGWIYRNIATARQLAGGDWRRRARYAS
jgi:putative MATE family efflux protein